MSEERVESLEQDLEAVRTQFKESIEEHKSVEDLLQGQLKATAQRGQRVAKELKDAQSALAEKEKAFEQAQVSATEVERLKEETQLRAESLAEELAIAKDQARKLEDERSSLAESLAEQASAAALNTEKLEGAMADKEREAKEALAAKEEELGAASKRESELKESLAAAQEEGQKLEAINATLEEEKLKLAGELMSHEKSVLKLSDEVSALRAEVGSLQEQTTTMTSTIATLQARVAKKGGENKKLQEEHEKATKKSIEHINELQMELRDSINRAAALEKAKSAAERKTTKLKVDIGKMRREAKKLRDDHSNVLKKRAAEFNKISADFEKASAREKDLRGKIETKEKEMAKSLEREAELKKRVAAEHAATVLSEERAATITGELLDAQKTMAEERDQNRRRNAINVMLNVDRSLQRQTVVRALSRWRSRVVESRHSAVAADLEQRLARERKAAEQLEEQRAVAETALAEEQLARGNAGQQVETLREYLKIEAAAKEGLESQLVERTEELKNNRTLLQKTEVDLSEARASLKQALEDFGKVQQEFEQETRRAQETERDLQARHLHELMSQRERDARVRTMSILFANARRMRRDLLSRGMRAFRRTTDSLRLRDERHAAAQRETKLKGALKLEHSAAMQSVQALHEDAMQNLKENHDAAVGEIGRQGEKSKEALRAKLTRKHEDATRTTKAAHKREMDKSLKELKRQRREVTALRTEILTRERLLVESGKKVATRVKDLAKQNSKRDAEMTRLEQQISTLRTQIKSKATSAVRSLQDKLSTAHTDLAKQQQSAMRASEKAAMLSRSILELEAKHEAKVGGLKDKQRAMLKQRSKEIELLRAEIGSKTSALSKLTTRFDEQKQVYLQTRKRSMKMHEQLANAANERQRLEQAVTAQERELEKAQKRLQTASKSRENAQDSLKGLEKSLDAANSQNRKLREKLKDQKKEQSGLESKLASSRSTVDDQARKLEALKKKAEAAKKTERLLETARSNLERLEKSMQGAQTRHDEQTVVLKERIEELKTLKAEMEGMRRELGAATGKNRELESATESLAKDKNAEAKKRESLRGDLSAARQTIAEHVQKSKEQQQRVLSMNKEIVALTRKLSSAKAEGEKAEKKIAELENSVDELSMAKEVSDQKFEILTKKVSDQMEARNSDIKELTKSVKKTMVELEKKGEENAVQRRELGVMSGTLKELKQKLAKAEGQIDDMTRNDLRKLRLKVKEQASAIADGVKKLAVADGSLKAAEKERGRANKQVTQSERLIKQLTTQVANLQGKGDVTDRELKLAQKELEQEKVSRKAKAKVAAELQKKVTKLSGEIDALARSQAEQSTKFAEDVRALKLETTTVARERDALQKRVSTEGKRMGQLLKESRQELEDKEQALNRAEKKHSAASEAQQEKIARMQTIMKRLEKDLKSSQDNLEAIKANDMEQLKSKIVSQRTKMDADSGRLVELERAIDEGKKERKKLLSQISTAKTRHDSLSKVHEKTQSELATEKQALAKAREEAARMEKVLRAEISNLEKEKAQILKRTAAAAESLRTELAGLQGTLSELRGEKGRLSKVSRKGERAANRNESSSCLVPSAYCTYVLRPRNSTK